MKLTTKIIKKLVKEELEKTLYEDGDSKGQIQASIAFMEAVGGSKLTNQSAYYKEYNPRDGALYGAYQFDTGTSKAYRFADGSQQTMPGNRNTVLREVTFWTVVENSIEFRGGQGIVLKYTDSPIKRVYVALYIKVRDDEQYTQGVGRREDRMGNTSIIHLESDPVPMPNSADAGAALGEKIKKTHFALVEKLKEFEGSQDIESAPSAEQYVEIAKKVYGINFDIVK